ncbi:hypothetical protein PoB_001059300 [Plakobranchus ocellatus]|uniref:Uncharacterized protein n=1 Tax=Plakobranchus ocellatus TaxID=259542 RepID=A0AAV3YP15_9GAST|nr:hypothetical protein PoB_001059300 [Plakobranchus ocellatus]
MDDIVKWVYDVAMSHCGETIKESVEKYPGLELPYPGWIRNEDVVIATEGTPEEYMELVNILYRGMVYFGYKDESFVETVEKRMAVVREILKKDTGSDAQNCQLFFPTVIYLAHKPLANKT